MSNARDVVQVFEDASLGTYGSTLFVSSKAVTKSGTVATVILTPGIAPSRVQNRRTPALEYPSALIVVRAEKFSEADAFARTLYDACWQVSSQEVNGTMYHSMTPQQVPFDMGTDDNGRMKVGFNVLMRVARA